MNLCNVKKSRILKTKKTPKDTFNSLIDVY